MGKGKRRGNNGKRMGDDKHKGDGIPPPAPPVGADDQGKLAEEAATLRAFNTKIIAELVETRARLAAEHSLVADGVQKQQQLVDDGEVVLAGDVKEPHLHGATKAAAVQERTDVEKDAIAKEADVAALPALSEVSDAVSAVVDGEDESEEESPEEEEKLKSPEEQGKAAEVSAGADVETREVHVAAADSEEDASLRARLAAAEARAARLEAANAEKIQALERLGAKEAEAKAASKRVAELEKRLGEMNISAVEAEGTMSTELPAAARPDPGKQKKKKAPAGQGRRSAETEKPVVVAAALPARRGGKVEGSTRQTEPELDAGQAHGGRPRTRRTLIPNTRYPSDTFVIHGDAARVGFGQHSDESS